MIQILLRWFVDYTGLTYPHVIDYLSTRMMLAAFTTLVGTIFVGPLFIRKLYELKIGQHIRKDDCPVLHQLHEKKQDTPTMGGLLILACMLLSLFLWMNLTHIFTFLLLITTVALGGLGAYDDYLKLRYKNAKGIAGRKKMVVQLAVGFIVMLYFLLPEMTAFFTDVIGLTPPVIKQQVGSYGAMEELSLSSYMTQLFVPFVKVPFWGLWSGFILFLGLFVIVGSSNSVNLTDGLDGLAAGCLVTVAMVLAAVAFVSNHILVASYLNIPYIEGAGEIAIFLSAFIGGCLGFLWYNGSPAQVFMGDTGSLALGGIIGVSAVLLKRELLLGVIGIVFVLEALSVIIQVGSYRFRNKKRVFLCAPLHHHFEYKGWAETKIVVRFWIISLLAALLGLASLKFQ